MTDRRRWLLAFAALLLLSSTVLAQDPIRFARTPDLSPDGKTVAFSYLGDIWTVEAIGGVARRVTVHEAHEINPVFSPDGRSIAFSSNRYGGYDIFVIPAQGGEARRLTFDSCRGLRCGWSPDGKNILFSSTRSTDFPFAQELYTVPVEGGRAARHVSRRARKAFTLPRATRSPTCAAPARHIRSGYRGSSNDDVWVCNADGTNNRRLTSCNCQDNSPMWAPDGKLIYYVSECATPVANIVRQEPCQQHADGPARSPSTRTMRSARHASAPMASGLSTSAAPICG